MIHIVSGVPRSGTSLMMQMLAAGGMALLTDGVRAADEDNLRGYFEWEKARQLPKDPALIAEAEGKVVKVISSLLLALPADQEYRVIFMERPLEEVVASQAVMLARRGTKGSALPAGAMANALRNHVKQVNAWLARQSSVEVCRVAYHDLLNNPNAECERLESVLGTPLQIESMIKQVEPSLYRQRSAD